jgi:hypothetical protein
VRWGCTRRQAQPQVNVTACVVVLHPCSNGKEGRREWYHAWFGRHGIVTQGCCPRSQRHMGRHVVHQAAGLRSQTIAGRRYISKLSRRPPKGLPAAHV